MIYCFVLQMINERGQASTRETIEDGLPKSLPKVYCIIRV